MSHADNVCICGARVLEWDKDDEGCTWLSTGAPIPQGCYLVLGPNGIAHACSCCGSRDLTTAGCIRCTSVRTFCSCGVLLMCGCGKTNEHRRCPNVSLLRNGDTLSDDGAP